MAVNDKKELTITESYEVMLQFLKNWYALTKNTDLTDVLSGAEYLHDKMPADPVFYDYWQEAYEQVKKGDNDPFKKEIL
ncbi:hypothetical protein ABW636_06345 [Aquimarina sp. 2201CG1-2-11]|uniref:hypothetical protein n=1 Tax=Aquimarina discodermiae TaxID=3231043 RepID=UPI0034638232